LDVSGEEAVMRGEVRREVAREGLRGEDRAGPRGLVWSWAAREGAAAGGDEAYAAEGCQDGEYKDDHARDARERVGTAGGAGRNEALWCGAVGVRLADCARGKCEEGRGR
jgi:hypothetical protein